THSHPHSTRFPYTTLFRSMYEYWTRSIPSMLKTARRITTKFSWKMLNTGMCAVMNRWTINKKIPLINSRAVTNQSTDTFLNVNRSEEHTSELQSRFDLVCR